MTKYSSLAKTYQPRMVIDKVLCPDKNQRDHNDHVTEPTWSQNQRDHNGCCYSTIFFAVFQEFLLKNQTQI